MIEIITKGKVPTYTAKCAECETIFTCTKADIYVKQEWTDLTGISKGDAVKCPMCGAEIIYHKTK